MDEHSDTNDFAGEQLRGFGRVLQTVRGVVNWLVSLVSVTEQDLLDAGVYLRRMGD